MALKLRETGRSKRSNKLTRINTASLQGFSTSPIGRTTNNNLIASPGGTVRMELQQTNSHSKRCKSLDCSPLGGEPTCLMNERKCSQSDRHSTQCINCSQPNYTPNRTHSPHPILRKKQSKTACIECCRDYITINNNNECLLNKNLLQTSSIKKNNQHSIHRNIQSPSQQNDSKQCPLQHHSSLQKTGSIHSNLMMPIISNPVSGLCKNSRTEYIVLNKKKVILIFKI